MLFRSVRPTREESTKSSMELTSKGANSIAPKPSFTEIEGASEIKRNFDHPHEDNNKSKVSVDDHCKNTISLVAATAAALATSASSSSTERSTKIKGGARRRGKWTAEEEDYVARVIQDFNSGFLNAPAGYTLRSYLSDKLQCDPMRITKKFTGESCIGKRVFHPAVRTAANAAAIDKAQVSL